MNTLELFADGASGAKPSLGPGITLLRGFARSAALMPLIEQVAARAPFRHLVTPGGQTMSVAMTNCGPLGWVSDRSGYRYDAIDPLSGRPWPEMPREIREHEPLEALSGGPDGLAFYRRLIGELPQWLKPGGWVIVEVGDGQAGLVQKLFEHAGLLEVEVTFDLHNLPRVVEGRLPYRQEIVPGLKDLDDAPLEEDPDDFPDVR